ncbi:MAG TPA: hypothetical protein VF928_15800 [Usitatibacteraceae bacterium]
MKTIPWRFYIALALTAGLGPGFGVGTGLGAARHSYWLGALMGLLIRNM